MKEIMSSASEKQAEQEKDFPEDKQETRAEVLRFGNITECDHAFL